MKPVLIILACLAAILIGYLQHHVMHPADKPHVWYELSFTDTDGLPTTRIVLDPEREGAVLTFIDPQTRTMDRQTLAGPYLLKRSSFNDLGK